MRACPMRHFFLGSKLSQSSPRASSHRTVGSSWVYRWPPRGPRCQRTPTLNPSPPPHCQRTSPWAPFPHLLTRCTLRDSPILTQLTLGHLIHWLTNGDHAAAVTWRAVTTPWHASCWAGVSRCDRWVGPVGVGRYSLSTWRGLQTPGLLLYGPWPRFGPSAGNSFSNFQNSFNLIQIFSELPKFIATCRNLRKIQTKFPLNPWEQIYTMDLITLSFSHY
jgi:hypothetical protein